MTSQQRGQLLRAVGRAVPRPVCAVAGFTCLGSERTLLVALGSALFVGAVMTNWARWWRYVRTGTTPPQVPAADFTQQGTFAVELHDPGTRRIQVIKAVREVTGAELTTAVSWVDGAPTTIASGVSEDSARRVRDRVERAGATATLAVTDGGS